ncbi:MAG: phosphatidylglycerol lysyltransferase domain-containing protein [Streptosporangiaceae bacterium]
MPSSVSLGAPPVGRERAAGPDGSGTREHMIRRRRRLARLCLGWAALSLLSELTPLGYWLNTTLPAYWYAVTWLAAGAPSVGFAVLLGALSAGLRRGRAMAFWLVAICLALAGPLGFLAGSLAGGWLPLGQVPTWFWIAVAVHLGLLGVLLSQWRAFRIPSDHAGLRRLAWLVPVAALGVLLGVTLVAATDTGHAPTAQRAAYVLQRAVADTGLWPVTTAVHVPWGVNLLINLIAGLLVVAALYLLLRSPRHAPVMTRADEARLRALLAEHGARDSLGYFALRDDKNVVFSPTGKAAIGYRVLGGVSLAAGDPIGDPEAWPGAIAAWQEQAEQRGWRRAVLGASEQAALAYQRFGGLHALTLGDEAVVEVAGFDLSGRAMRGVRQAHARVGRAGYTVTATRQRQLDPGTLGMITRSAASWRDGAAERGFSMALGRIGDPADPDYLLLQCYDRDHRLRAVLGFAPWGRWGLSLDLMIRDRQAGNGLIEFMIVELATRAPALGVERISLNFAMFRDVFAAGARIGAGPVLRAHRRLLLVASRWWQLESLYRANLKYQPSWIPRYLCYATPSDLVPVLAAAGRAEGFLP